MVNFSNFKNKTILITGHTGFKGSWLTRILVKAGAKVIGYSLNPPTNPSLYELADIKNDGIISIIADIRDFDKLKETFDKYNPEYVIHLAAQPIVRYSYKEPRLTYETNVMGIVNLMECIRLSNSVKSVVNVTTDKVYFNEEIEDHLFKEDDKLDGYDPYSNSKSCSELVTHSYFNSFLKDKGIRVSTCRAGNVIGGGDFASDRIIPDCIRALINKKDMIIRNPYSIRPYQHVLEPLFAYLEILDKQVENEAIQGAYNMGPDREDFINTGELVRLFASHYHGRLNYRIEAEKNAVHEAIFLKLDNSKLKEKLNWKPTWHISKVIVEIASFTDVYLNNGNIKEEMDREIDEFNS